MLSAARSWEYNEPTKGGLFRKDDVHTILRPNVNLLQPHTNDKWSRAVRMVTQPGIPVRVVFQVNWSITEVYFVVCSQLK